MPLIVYRPEYRIYLDERHNHLTYERLEELTLATSLPQYLPDIERAIRLVQPGFTLLVDLRRTLGPNLRLLPLFHQSRELLRAGGVSLIVEVHPPSPSMRQFMQQLRDQDNIPTRLFTDISEAEAYLYSIRQQLTP